MSAVTHHPRNAIMLDTVARSSAAAFEVVKAWIGRQTDSSTPLLPFIPKSVKIILLLLCVLNSPSWPFAWHLRVWYYPLKAYWEVYTKGSKRYIDDFEKSSQKAGGIKTIVRTKRIAWVDDCDYNMHLSNSCYAKNADASRMKWCIDAMAPIFTPGCHMALGASHYVFIKEVPLGHEYVMETRMGGWDDKWIYLVTEFVIYPKKRSGKNKSKASGTPAHLGVPSISAPPSGTASPEPGSGSNTPSTAAESVKKAATLRVREPRTDGGVTCALVVTEYCVKAGRITVPPRIAWHFSMLSPDKTQRDRIRPLLFKTKDKGKAWCRGGWKEEKDADTLGLEIGHDFSSQAQGSAAWVEEAKEGMKKVNEGLGVF